MNVFIQVLIPCTTLFTLLFIILSPVYIVSTHLRSVYIFLYLVMVGSLAQCDTFIGPTIFSGIQDQLLLLTIAQAVDQSFGDFS